MAERFTYFPIGPRSGRRRDGADCPADGQAAWERFALDNDADLATVRAIADVADYYAKEHDLDAEQLATDLTAVLMKESNIQHCDDDGNVKRGDNGKAVGIGQLWPVWEKHFEKDRENEYWNIWMAAGVLIYSGWTSNRRRAIGKYNGGPNPNYRYADAVLRTVKGMR